MSLRGRNNLTDEEFFFVTTTVVNFTRIFIKDSICKLLIKNIKFYQHKYNFEILAYIIMPSHFHWVLKTDKRKGTISDIMRDIKNYSAWDILELLKQEKSLLLNNFELTGRHEQKHQLWIHRYDDEVIRNE
jgi:REP element-mobilizing transposase RayT